MSFKLLVNGLAGAGKTQLLKTLDPETTFVVSRDAKNFTLELPHMLVDNYYNMTTLLYGGKVKDENGDDVEIPGIIDKLNAFVDHFGNPPKVVVIDSVSQIFMDVIEVASLTPNVYGSQGAEVTKEMGLLTKFLHEELEQNGISTIFLNHVIEEKADGKKTGDYISFGSGKFLEKGGFYSITNEAITLTMEAGHRIIYTRGRDKLARTFLEEVPTKMYVENYENPEKSKKLKDGEKYFTLADYVNALEASQKSVDKFRF